MESADFSWTFLRVCLVGGFLPTHLKNMQPSNWIISSGSGKNKKYLKPPSSCTILVIPFDISFRCV